MHTLLDKPAVIAKYFSNKSIKTLFGGYLLPDNLINPNLGGHFRGSF